MSKLPVFRSVGEVYSGTYRHFWDLARLAWLPLAGVIAVNAVFQFWLMPQQPTGVMTPEQSMVYLRDFGPDMLAFFVSSLVLTAVMAVDFHRFVLLGERVRGVGGTGFDFGKKELRYIWSLIKILLALFLAGLVVGTVVAGLMLLVGERLKELFQTAPDMVIVLGAVVYVSFVVALIIVMMRLSLVLPDVALGQPSNLRAIWRKTSGNGWRLFGYGFLVFLPIFLLALPVGFLRAAWWPVAVVYFIPFLAFGSMLGVTYLSVAYREIIGLPAGMGPGVPETPEPV